MLDLSIKENVQKIDRAIRDEANYLNSREYRESLSRLENRKTITQIKRSRKLQEEYGIDFL